MTQRNFNHLIRPTIPSEHHRLPRGITERHKIDTADFGHQTSGVKGRLPTP